MNSPAEIKENSRYIIKGKPITKEYEGSIGLAIFNSMKLHRNDVAQVDTKTDKKDTYADFLKRCIRTALKLKSKGITREDIISICSYNHLNSSTPFIAAQFLGAKTACFDPILPYKDTCYLLKQVSPKVIFVSDNAIDMIAEAVKQLSLNTEIVTFGSDFEEYIKPHSDENLFQPSPISSVYETCLISFSSGTTGYPKGICISHYSLLVASSNDLDGSDEEQIKADALRISYPLTYLGYASLYWISGSLSVTICSTNGLCRLLCEKFDPKEIWWLIDKYKPICIALLPMQAISMCDVGRPKDVELSNLLRLYIIGAPISEEQMIFIRKTVPEWDVYQGYGQTEIPIGLSTFNPQNKFHREMFSKKPKSVGMPNKGVLYKVVDIERNEILGPNQKGELCVKSKCVMNGYYNLDSSETFDDDGWLKTGDIVYYDEEFCFYVVDRIKEMLKYGGWVIAPAALEHILMEHPSVKEAVVIGIPADDGDHLMGLVIVNEHSTSSPQDIQKFFEMKVSEQQQLRAGIKFVASFPLTPTGKVNRVELKKKFLNAIV